MAIPSSSAVLTNRGIPGVVGRRRNAALDLLIVNPALPGLRISSKLLNQQGALKVIPIEDSDRGATDIREAQSEWIAKVQEALEKSGGLVP